MPTARCAATAVGYHSMLIVVGGVIMVEGRWTVLSTTELLDATNGCWYTCNNLPSPHQLMKAAIINDELYLLGGANKYRKSPPQVHVASLDTLSAHQLHWQSAPNTPWYSSSICCSVQQVLIDCRRMATKSYFRGVHFQPINWSVETSYKYSSSKEYFSSSGCG